MSSVVGIGGESIILDDSSNTISKTVLKVTPVHKLHLAYISSTTIEYKYGIKLPKIRVDTNLAYEKNPPNELTANALEHKNIILIAFGIS